MSPEASRDASPSASGDATPQQPGSGSRPPGRRRAVVLALGLCLVLGAVVWGVHVTGYRPGPPPGAAGMPAGTGPPADRDKAGARPDASASRLGHPWRGAIHAHSSRSDGAGTLDEIVEAAASVGLDFIVVTDHNPLGGRPAAGGWHGDLLVVVAEEISTLGGHLLALSTPPHRYRFGPEARQAVADVEELGGWALAAHPAHPETPWTAGWGLVQGLEVVNAAEAWERAAWRSHMSVILSYPLNADFAALRLLAEPSPALAAWDRRTGLGGEVRARRMVGVAAADAHGPVLGPWPFPGYAEVLAAVNTVVWLDRPPSTGDGAAADSLLGALRAGRAAGVVRSVADPEGFFFAAWRQGAAGATGGPPTSPALRSPGPATAPSGRPGAVVGEIAAWEEGPWTLAAGFDAVAPVRTVLLRDGMEVASADGQPLVFAADRPGTYRVEVYRLDGLEGAGTPGSTPWIIANPIYLWPASARLAARVHRVPPLPAPPVAESLMAAPGWTAESGGGAAAAMQTGPQMEWRFELPEPGGPDSFASLAWRSPEPVDWSATGGLVLSLRARQQLRVIVEVRGVAAQGHEVAWYRSVKAGPEAPAEAIPWPMWRQRSAGLDAEPIAEASRPGRGEPVQPPAQGGPRPRELERVTGVFLIVTPSILVPGTVEAVTVQEVGVF